MIHNSKVLIHDSKVLQFSSPILQYPPTTIPHHRCRPICSSSSPPTISTEQHFKLSRRGLGNSSLLVLLASYQTLLDRPKARAEEEAPSPSNNKESCSDRAPTKQAFLDISIDREPAGRIVIGLYGNQAPAGAARFSSLVSGAAGVTYRRKEFVRITPKYVQHGGVRSFGVDAELANRTGSGLSAQSLVGEWARQSEECTGTRNLAGTVGIVVRDPLKPPPKMKLVARQGKLQMDEEEVGTEPNGTEFVITYKDSPELDASVLVIGKVLLGMEVAERIGLVKTVQDNTSSPYFRVAKLIGDKRAVVAERGFNRPYSKVQVTNCGLLE